MQRKPELVSSIRKMEKPSIKVGTKEESLWTAVEKSQETKIADLENELIVSKAVLKLAKDKILLEKRK